MRTLKANMRVLGLAVGETFQSDAEFYDPFVRSEMLSVVPETEAEEAPQEPLSVDPAPATPDVLPTPQKAAAARRKREEAAAEAAASEGGAETEDEA